MNAEPDNFIDYVKINQELGKNIIVLLRECLSKYHNPTKELDEFASHCCYNGTGYPKTFESNRASTKVDWDVIKGTFRLYTNTFKPLPKEGWRPAIHPPKSLSQIVGWNTTTLQWTKDYQKKHGFSKCLGEIYDKLSDSYKTDWTAIHSVKRISDDFNKCWSYRDGGKKTFFTGAGSDRLKLEYHRHPDRQILVYIHWFVDEEKIIQDNTPKPRQIPWVLVD
jgi:hypothetical protein